ncbi:MAG TPA: caspase family protein [Solirubrobacterales bacterium]|jgi:streptogramin lyase|nr:caspase family protein [Solirubrobacterales bacterium]
MPTTAEGAAGRRLALVVATGSYVDPTLAKLRAPGQDASDLAAVLEDAAVGQFEVEMVFDAPAESLRRRIAQFCTQMGPGDLALVYLSCHGVLDDRGRLYYATVDTDRALLSATAVPSAWLNEQLEDCRSRRQILVLDCCHSGAFAKGAKGEGSLGLRERFEGRGRVVLTGSRGTEYSFEHGHVVGDGVSSVFTSALVKGLRSGDADRDGDGMVTVSELYDYAYEAVRERESRQTPTLWTYGAEGDLLVAHSPRGAIVEPAPLPEDLLMLLESARPRVREGAVTELADLLAGPDAGRALTARAELERIAVEDVPSVATAARAALDAAQPQPPQPAAPTRAPRPPEPAHQPPPPPPSKPAAPPAAGRPGPRDRGPSRRAIAIGIAIAAIVPLAAAMVLAMGGGGDDSAKAGVIAVEGSPRGIAVDDDAAWVARYDDNQVGKIKRSTSSESQSISVGQHPDEIAAGEGSVWVSVDNGRGLARIDPETNEEVETAPEQEGCVCPIAQLAIGPGKLWVSSAEQHTIGAFDLESGDEIGAPYYPGPGFEGAFAVDGDAVWAIGNDGPVSWVRRIDSRFGQKGKRVSLEAGSHFNGVAFGQGRVWISDSGRNQVVPFDPDREEFGKGIDVEHGISDDDIAAATGGVIVWNARNGWMTKIDSEEMKVAQARRLSDYPTNSKIDIESSDLSVDQKYAWVTDPAGGAVYRVKYWPKLIGF